jgi:hypothetical protein
MLEGDGRRTEYTVVVARGMEPQCTAAEWAENALEQADQAPPGVT